MHGVLLHAGILCLLADAHALQLTARHASTHTQHVTTGT